MEVTIVQEKENPLLERKDVEISVTFDNETPSRMDLRKSIAAKVKSKEELVIIPNILNRFGKHTVVFQAHVYTKEDVIPLIENRNTLFRHMGKDAVKETKDTLKAARKVRIAKRKKK